MEKPFRPLPLETLARWIFRDLESGTTVLGMPKENLELPDPKLALTRMGRTFAAPLGVAAGPHTQLAQNIVAAWLAGARFIELKTVQTLDEIHVSKPCIDAEDAAFNCEWSQELQLAQSFDEYLKAWVLLHAIAHKLGLKDPGVFFSMSVGYDLAGIQGEKVQTFLRRMRNAKDELPAAIEAVAQAYPAVRELPISAELSNQITLSTMHGCPPAEIEKIARYLLTDLGVHTWVKLNPTLLGPERLRKILNEQCGFDIEVPDLAFEHDPRFEDAMKMVRNLIETAKGRQNSFGLKLSNTLEVVNKRAVFPPNEKMMYMSGRSLHPLTINLAHLVTEELDGQVPISFCGGADAINFPELVADGLSPITVCTDLLKPGGYARLQQYLVHLESEMARLGAENLEQFVEKSADHKEGARGNLKRHAERAITEKRFVRRDKPIATKGDRALGFFDCIAAPCQEGCPTHQNIPDYLWMVANGRPNEAADVILRTNALPGVTGCICDHPCMDRCIRNHYEAPVNIREVKRYAIEHGKPTARTAGKALGVRVAVVGAGPAGLSAAFYLAQAGFSVTVFEARKEFGGMAGGIIPPYRMGREPLAADVARVQALGVEFKLGVRVGKDVTLSQLTEQGFGAIFLGVGAAAGKGLGIAGDDSAGVLDALSFLDEAKAKGQMELGDHVLIVGGGNSAMDAARTARRFVKSGTVDLVYRRTRAQMPADPEEIEACIEEGVGLKDLLAPLRVAVEGGKVSGLVCGVMKLGAPDASGRPRPEATGEEITLPCTTLIAAIGQEPVLEMLEGVAVERNRDGTIKVDPKTQETSIKGLFAGGDVVRGPASIIKGVADGRFFAEALARRHGVEMAPEPMLAKNEKTETLLAKKAQKKPTQTVPVLPVAQRGGFDVVHGALDAEKATMEANRCLDCDELCSICVTVCPNRANQAYVSRPLSLEVAELVARGGKLEREGSHRFAVEQGVQTLNIGDSCNECGNCASFCPTAGAPYQDKPRFWLDREGFETAKGNAFHMVREGAQLTLEGKLEGQSHSLKVTAESAEYRGPKAIATFKPESWELLEVKANGALAEGEKTDLQACAVLIALIAAEPAVLVGRK